MRNQVQLIAYVDRLSGGGFRALQELLDGPFAGLFGGAHLLPFYWPIDGADAGFDPIDHTQPDSRLGSWDDVRALAAGPRSDGRLDRQSCLQPLARNSRISGKHGDLRLTQDLFLTYGRVFPKGASESGSAPDLSPASGAAVHQDAIG